MNKCHIMVVVLTVLLFVSTRAAAVSVWHSAWQTGNGTPVDFYLVTDFDDASDAYTGALLDFYVDFTPTYGGQSAITPADLLTQSASSLVSADIYDIAPPSPPTSTGMDADLVWIGLTSIAIDWIYNQYVQPIGVSGDMQCFYTGYCSLNGGFIDISSGSAISTVLFDNSSNLFTQVATSAVPLPAAAWLFGSGMLGLVGIARRKKTA